MVLYAGLANLFPKWHIARAYRSTQFGGKQFHAEVTEHGIEVNAESYGWRVKWQDVQVKGENDRVFMLYSRGTHTIFIFGKKYLTGEQQFELRALAGLASQEA